MATLSTKTIKLKPDTSDSASLTKDNVILRCGDCTHYRGTPHPSIKVQCKENGIRPGASAPVCFTPNVAVFREMGPEVMGQIAALITSFSPQQNRVLMGLMKGAASLEKVGLHFLQKVYFCTGTDSLENYYSAYVLCLGPDKSVMLVGRDYLRCNNSSVVATLSASSLITSVKKFRAIKDKLVATGKIRANNERLRKAMSNIEYEPPMFDTNPEILEARANKSAKLSRKGPTKDKLFSVNQGA